MNLLDIFGYCIIPKGTLLFRGHRDPTIKHCMFFTTKHWLAGAFDDNIQIWKTKEEIKVIFLCEFVDSRSWTKSAIPRLYKIIFPNEAEFNYCDLDIKHRNLERRDKFILKLNREFSLRGWFSSLEENMELEVCLFGTDANQKQLELVEITNKNHKIHFGDSLKKIKVYPTIEFYEKSYQKIQRNSFELVDKKTIWNKYQKYVKKICIKEDSKSLEEITFNKEYWSNLRMKLKI